MPKPKSIFVQFEFDTTEGLKEGLKQLEKRRRKGKAERDGVKVNDRSLLKKLENKRELKKVELVRIHCFSSFETTMLAVQGVYRKYYIDGTAREFKGTKHYFDSGELSFKTTETFTEPSRKIKLSFERQGIVIKVNNQEGQKGRVSPSMKVGFIRG